MKLTQIGNNSTQRLYYGRTLLVLACLVIKMVNNLSFVHEMLITMSTEKDSYFIVSKIFSLYFNKDWIKYMFDT